MRVKQVKKQMRVYMNPQDYDTMIDSAGGWPSCLVAVDPRFR